MYFFSSFQIELRDNQEYAALVKEVNIPQLGLQVMQLLMDESGGSLPIMELCMRYESKFSCSCDLNQIKEELCDFVQVCLLPKIVVIRARMFMTYHEQDQIGTL